MAWALMRAGTVDAAVFGTAHDFSNHTPDGDHCMFCHVPHNEPGMLGGGLLIWNHVLSSAPASFSDATATTGGTTLPTNIQTWSGSSKLCLSCHDGTVEIGRMYEPPTIYDTGKVTGGAKIGPDLKGNHPVSVPYPFNQAQNTYNGITTGSVLKPTEYVAAPTGVRLYADTSLAGPNNVGIECGSCHDPHKSDIPLFLRVNVTLGSPLCFRCHIK